MTVEQAQELLLKTDIKVAFQHRFAYDSGTMLRLDNYAIVTIFDDGRYYVQGENTETLIPLFAQVEKPWDPNTWTGEMPNHRPEHMPDRVVPWFAPRTPPKRA
jgi:predicted nucleotide-binding protein